MDRYPTIYWVPAGSKDSPQKYEVCFIPLRSSSIHLRCIIYRVDGKFLTSFHSSRRMLLKNLWSLLVKRKNQRRRRRERRKNCRNHLVLVFGSTSVCLMYRLKSFIVIIYKLPANMTWWALFRTITRIVSMA